MVSKPEWVKALKPSGPQGSELLKRERDRSSLDVEKLSEFMFTKEVLDRQGRILKILESEDVFDKSQNYFEGRADRIQTALARAKRLEQLTVKHNWSQEEFHMANQLISEPTPYGLHASMFLVTFSFMRVVGGANPLA
jgi:acyl-CoA oxidase